MPFGKHKEKPLHRIPRWYWEWFIEQEWAADNWPVLMAYCEAKLGRKHPPRKPRKMVLTQYGTVTGKDYDPSANDGTCPFDPD